MQLLGTVSLAKEALGSGSTDRSWLVYALKCRGDVLYIGVTNNLEKRLQAHASGKGSRFVWSRRPFVVVAVIPCEGKREAMALEYRLKRLKRSRKLEELGLIALPRAIGDGAREQAD